MELSPSLLVLRTSLGVILWLLMLASHLVYLSSLVFGKLLGQVTDHLLIYFICFLCPNVKLSNRICLDLLMCISGKYSLLSCNNSDLISFFAITMGLLIGLPGTCSWKVTISVP